jgi:hypothetical protein
VLFSQADYSFGQVMSFRLTAENVDSIKTVILFFRAPEFPNAFSVNIPVTAGPKIDIEHKVDLSQVRLAPFTTVTFWWVLTTDSDQSIIVPEQSIDYEDDQFDWRQLEQDGITVYWTGDEAALGQLALDIVAEALPTLQAVIPTANAPSFQLYLYPSSADLRAALRLTGRDWVGAHADPELGVILVTAVNARTAATDLRQSIPHEMVHFLLYQAIGPAYDTLPLWFNEGLATYMETTPNPNYETILRTAVANRATIPFAELCRSFPDEEERALLAYAQSHSLLRYLQARYGHQVLGALVKAFADGADCQSAVSRTLDRSLADLNQAWLRDQQPRSPLVQFLYDNSLWLLLLVSSFAISTLLILTPYSLKRKT